MLVFYLVIVEVECYFLSKPFLVYDYFEVLMICLKGIEKILEQIQHKKYI